MTQHAPAPSAQPFRWGVFGTGPISAKFVAGLSSAQNAEAAFVASRSLGKAQSFAAALGIPRAVAGYAEAAEAGGVDAVYIATPASEHVGHALACIEAGIPVLVEKPFAITADDARRVVTAARARHVFAMEAMWTRFLPAAQSMKERLSTNSIGEMRLVTGSFGSSQVPDARASMFNASLGGGALAHLAPYPLSLAQWLFGSPTSVQAVGVMGDTGVDETVAFHLRYPGEVIGSFYVSNRAWAPDDFHVLGTEGSLHLRGSIVRPHGLDLAHEAPLAVAPVSFGLKETLRQHRVVHGIAQRVGRSSRASGKRHHARYSGNGYHYEADEVRACVGRGAIESTVMPLDDTLAVATTLDSIRSIVQQAPTERP